MLRKCFLSLITLAFHSSVIAFIDFEQMQNETTVVLAKKKIELKDYPGAYNPSLIKIDQGFLLTFRYCPHPHSEHWIAYIGVVILNDKFELISKPELLNTRPKNSKTPSQAEDARLFSYKGRLFVIYNDNVEKINPSTWDRRDMFIAELFYVDGHFTLSSPLKLFYEEKYNSQMWQKNWVPFEWEGNLLLSYMINPHEILFPNLITGACYPCYESWLPIEWKWGKLRGSTPPLLIDGEYLAFFHSGIVTSSSCSWGLELWHYFMGAYTFSASPPFEITKMTPSPIVAEGFYTPSYYSKRVIFPGGLVASDDYLYVAYGKDDGEIWIATMDKQALKKTMVPIETMTSEH